MQNNVRGYDRLEIPALRRRDQLFGAMRQDAAGAIEYRASAGGGLRPNPRKSMFHKSHRRRTGQSSFYYLMLAESCFQRAVGTRHANGSSTLREIGRNYLANASSIASVGADERNPVRLSMLRR
jgi:hypothetical protein